jgi:hypothetical protein
MKRLLLIFGLILAVTIPASATTYTVKAAGGGDFSMVQGCASMVVAGDTCVIYAGVYNETVTPNNSGSAGNPITFTTNPGDNVTIRDFVLSGLSYISITGTAANNLTVTGRITWTFVTHSVFQYITNTGGASGPCFGGGGWYSSGTATSFNQFLNLTVAYCGGTTNNNNGAIQFEGDYNLIDGLKCSNQQACVTLAGQFNVIRNNTWGPTCGDGSSCSPSVIGANHSQPIEASLSCGPDRAGGLQHLLAENNYSSQWLGSNSHTTILDTDTFPNNGCGSTSNVVRLTQGMTSGSYSAQAQTAQKLYFDLDSFSNTQLDNKSGPGGGKDREDLQLDPNASGGGAIDTIFSNMWSTSATPDWCLFFDTGYVENHNLCFLSGVSSWVGPVANSGSSNYDVSDIMNNQDPKFVNANTDLHLQVGSPAIGAGGPLTTAVGAGTTSTALTVVDANHFFAINSATPNSNIPNVQNDWIRIGSSTTVQISSINYSTNVITLTNPVNWSNGDGVYLYEDSNGNVVLNGANPNIGFDQSGFAVNGNLKAGRYYHTATLLNNGKVLIVGGFATGDGVFSSAELYDPSNGTSTYTSGALHTARFYHTATLLDDGTGRVLIAGGYGQCCVLSSAELYDPVNDNFTLTGSLKTGRVYNTATLLGDGKGTVLIAGGTSNGGSTVLSTAELFNPSGNGGAGSFTYTTFNMTTTREYFTATLLKDGTVLMAGGSPNPASSAELYNPSTQRFTATGSLNTGRWYHTATRLNDSAGTVLIAAGNGFTTSAELYNPTTGRFSTTGSMNTGRNKHTATILNDGTVLIAGGMGTGSVALSSAEIYNPSNGTFTATGSLNTARMLHTATLLKSGMQNGMVLITGGEGAGSATLSSVELGH